MPQPALHEIAGHCRTDRLADHEAHRDAPAGRLLRCPGDIEVQHQRGSARSTPPTDRLGEELARGEPVAPRQHGTPRRLELREEPRGDRVVNESDVSLVRRPGGCGPCGGATPEWRGRRGCASADGNRASCDGDGCSAGTYACSRDCSPGVGGVTRPVLGPGLGDIGRGGLRPFGWHRPPAANNRSPLMRAGPGRCPWTCGTGRHRFDRLTVRGAPDKGQTGRCTRAKLAKNRPPSHDGGACRRCHAVTIFANRSCPVRRLPRMTCGQPLAPQVRGLLASSPPEIPRGRVPSSFTWPSRRAVRCRRIRL